ncbi:Mobile element protein [Richelia intracellularis]|nr:Mobile element protein [Richelia intracellularis]
MLTNLRNVGLKVRPVYHYTAERVKAHIYVCCLIIIYNGVCDNF